MLPHDCTPPHANRAAGGVPALYMVWPAEARSFDFPGVSGSYLAALVMYEQLSGRDARGLAGHDHRRTPR